MNIKALVLLALVSPWARASPHDLMTKDHVTQTARVQMAGFQSKDAVVRASDVARPSAQVFKPAFGPAGSEASDGARGGSMAIVHGDYFSKTATHDSDKSGRLHLCAF